MRTILKKEMQTLEAMDNFFHEQNKYESLGVTPVGRLGGIKVTFVVEDGKKAKIVTVSRNELMKWAAHLVRERGNKETIQSVVEWLKAIDEMANEKLLEASSFQKSMRKVRRLSSNISKRKDILDRICSKFKINNVLPKNLGQVRVAALKADEEAKSKRKKKRKPRKEEEPVAEAKSEPQKLEKTKSHKKVASESEVPKKREFARRNKPLYHVPTPTPEEMDRILKESKTKKKKAGPKKDHREFKDWRIEHRKGRPKAEGTAGPSASAEDLGTFVKKDSPTGSVVIKDHPLASES